MALGNFGEIVLATTNKGKIRELTPFLQNLGLTVLTLFDFPDMKMPEESGDSFEANALLKAKFVRDITGLTALADDSGLVVPALNGRPGIYSARYGADYPRLPDESDEQRNIRKLLKELENCPATERAAFFCAVIAIVAADGRALIRKGIWNGYILKTPLGSNGFGYDPVFFDPANGKSAAQMSAFEKNEASHRGQAIKRIVEHLPSFLRAG